VLISKTFIEVMKNDMSTTNVLKLKVHPFVKWAGGKTQILHELEKYIPTDFNNYFEPFLGGGAFFFHLVSSVLSDEDRERKGRKYFLSDANMHIIDSFIEIEDDVEILIQLLKDYRQKYYENPKEYYYYLRREFNGFMGYTFVRVAMFIVLNKTCFNGLYRLNNKGEFNTPVGKFKNLPKIFNENNLRSISTLLNETKPILDSIHFLQALSKAREGDFIYLDPPHNPLSKSSNFTKYTQHGFDEKSQLTLYEEVNRLNRKGCKVLLSNSNTEFIKDLYSNYNIHEVEVRRSLNSNVKKRKTGLTELIISNYYEVK
jgi:DNA adenine methylase